jgi:four helix bundle protein
MEKYNIMNDLQKRLFEFSVGVLHYNRKLAMNPENRNIRDQLGRSGTASGASYEEAQGGCSRRDFHNKINISLKEMRETNFWLRLSESINGTSPEIHHLISESEHLMKILGSISAQTKSPKQ